MPSSFVCTDCGFETGKWSGKCPNCGSWSTLKESSRLIGKNKQGTHILHTNKPEKIVKISGVSDARMNTGNAELDLVLGGGIVSGMLILIGGEPGIGKSTLMLQLAEWLGKSGKKVLYCSGEESAAQIHMRSKRLQVSSENILLLCTNDTEHIIDSIEDEEPALAIVDSIQSISLSSIDSIPGSITQLREST
ncbi:MAG TPA: DNA repair protein RadA, partial [Candidatus Cloacimonas sp.]|nr:DNA repair protein RadA [Candidatus Cloacimonas sp.]